MPSVDFGEKNLPFRAGYPTPADLPDTTACRVFRIPADEDNASWLATFMGALLPLSDPEAWVQQTDGLTEDECAARWREMLDTAYDEAEDGCPTRSVPTPYWDEDTDVDDEESDETQGWYGYVEDPDAPPDELTFVERAAIWAFTGFLAVATAEIGFAPAILFYTIAPKMTLAVRRGDFASVIRILVDGEEAARVDTADASPGDLIRIPVVANPENSTHALMLVQVE